MCSLLLLTRHLYWLEPPALRAARPPGDSEPQRVGRTTTVPGIDDALVGAARAHTEAALQLPVHPLT